MAYERVQPFGGHIDDLRAVMGTAVIVNNLRQMFGSGDSKMLTALDLIPWYVRPPEKLLHDPTDVDYDADEHAKAIMNLLRGKATKGGSE